MKIFRPLNLIITAAILIPVIGAMYIWHHISDLAEPIIQPLNHQKNKNISTIPEEHLGLRLAEFSFTGHDGAQIPAIEAAKDAEDSSRQRSVLSEIDLKQTDKLQYIDYALVCVDWDYGIRSALPLAEYLTAAGIRCILWEPRGKDNARQYCTHGLRESEDIPHLIDALAKRCGKERPVIVAVGQGYGAGLLLRATAADDRIRGIVAIDAMASLRESISRTMPDGWITHIKLALIDFKISRTVGYECFDVAPVESATNINRNTPALIINLQQDNPIHTLNDALAIYRQLPCDTKQAWTLRNAGDPPLACTRTEICTVGQGENEQQQEFELRLMDNEEAAYTGIIRWLHDDFLTAIDKPHIITPQRPRLTPDSQL